MSFLRSRVQPFHRLVLLLLVITAVRMVLASLFPLGGDEAYHWQWSRHLDWGYYDHPPLTALAIRAGTLLFGQQELGVRFPAILLSAFASLVMYRLCFEVTRSGKSWVVEGTPPHPTPLPRGAGGEGTGHASSSFLSANPGNREAAFWSGLLVQCVPLLSFYGLFMSTDPASIFCWALGFWALYRAFFSHEPAPVAWSLAGLAAGLGLQAKFLNAFLAPCALVFALASPRRKQLLLSPWPWLGALIAFFVLGPFLYWNATHGWATFRFNVSARHTQSATWFTPVEYLLGQCIAVSPLLFCVFLYATMRCGWDGFRQRDERKLFLAAFSATMFLLFLLLSFRKPIGVYWAAPGYLGLCVLLPYCAFTDKPIISRRLSRWAAFTGAGMLLVVYAIATFWRFSPDTIAPLLHRAGLPDNNIYWMQGTEEASAAAVEMAGEMEAFLITPNYALSSGLAFYGPEQPETHLFRPTSIYGRNYVYWDAGFEEFRGRNAVFFCDLPPNAGALQYLNAAFQKVGEATVFEVERQGRVVRRFYLIPCFTLIRPEIASGAES